MCNYPVYKFVNKIEMDYDMDDKKADVIFYGFIVFDVTFDMLCVRVWLFVDHFCG